jgi:hypothetical protein
VPRDPVRRKKQSLWLFLVRIGYNDALKRKSIILAKNTFFQSMLTGAKSSGANG